MGGCTWVGLSVVGRVGPGRASTFHFPNPFPGVSSARGILGEHLVWLDALGVAIVTAGCLAVQLAKQNPTKA